MKFSSILTVIFLWLISAILIAGCAHPVAPTGGPKDEQHPLIEDIDPPSYTTRFDKKKITITFDEFIQLKDLNENLIISPPVDEKPNIREKGKSLIIEFEQELKDSTTYNIYFGNSVQDFNEGNPIENFQYVLSTGETIDSLSIEGTILNAFNLLPQQGVFVMLYEDLEDSVPIKFIPDYLSKTNEEGYFRINNIRENNYKLFCLRDFNKNYLFDLPNEEIAFTDSLIQFELVTHVHVDTIYKVDSINFKSNSINDSSVLVEREIDTIISESHTFYPVNNYVLMLFEEDRAVQYLANNKRDIKHKIEIMFNKPIKDSIVFTIADTTIENDWYIKEENQTRDTIFYWLTDSTIYNKEELSCAISYQKEDSNLVYQWTTDTVNFKFFEIKKKKGQEVDTSLKFTINLRNRAVFDLDKQIGFDFDYPVAKIDTSKINLFMVIDSVDFPVKYDFLKDSSELRKYWIFNQWDEDSSYRLELFPDALIDIYGFVNDTSIVEFKTQKRDFYGKILVDLTGIDSSFQVIAQLVIPGKEEEKIYREQVIKKDQIVEFDFLPPKEFVFKVILDKNFNGKWDTGEYIEHVQPEEVLYHESEIKVRSNWDIEENLNVKKE